MNNSFEEVMQKIKQEKSEEEFAAFVKDFTNTGAVAIYTVIVAALTDEDFDALEKIENDAEAEQEMQRRFHMRTGKTPEAYMVELRDAMTKGIVDAKNGADLKK